MYIIYFSCLHGKKKDLYFLLEPTQMSLPGNIHLLVSGLKTNKAENVIYWVGKFQVEVLNY